MISAYIIHLLILAGIFGIASIALNLTLGCLGIVNLGHIAFMAIGAYVSAILTTMYGVPIFLAIFFGALSGSAFAAFVAFLTRTLTQDVLAIVLLGSNFATFSIAMNWGSMTRGSLGIPGIPRPDLLIQDRWYLVFVLILCGLAFVFTERLLASPFGRVLGAIRDDELHTRVLGKRTFRTKFVVFMISGFLAGLAGALQAHAIGFINPSSFFVPSLVLVLSMVMIGGLGSMRGTIIGAMIVTFLPEIVNMFITVPSAALGAFRAMTFSLLLLLVVIFRPKGLIGTVELPTAYAQGD